MKSILRDFKMKIGEHVKYGQLSYTSPLYSLC